MAEKEVFIEKNELERLLKEASEINKIMSKAKYSTYKK